MSTERTKAKKIALYKRFFMGRTDVYGTHDPATGRGWQVKAPVTDAVLLSHLKGKKPYGIYLLNGDRTTAVVVDFDVDDSMLPQNFVKRARVHGIPAYIEISKSKGYHIWIFFNQKGVLAKKARLVTRFILEQMGNTNAEIFPKQDSVDSSTFYGNFINAPLFWKYIQKGRTVFVDMNMEPYPNQWDFLESTQRVSEGLLDKIIERNGLHKIIPVQDAHVPVSTENNLGTLGLRPCAQQMLKEGVTANQRVACFWLAVQLRKAGLPCDCTLGALQVWARKNHPTNGKSAVTASEIKGQTESAYKEKQYRGCGCADEAVKPFCDPSCPIRRGGTEVTQAMGEDARS